MAIYFWSLIAKQSVYTKHGYFHFFFFKIKSLLVNFVIQRGITKYACISNFKEIDPNLLKWISDSGVVVKAMANAM